MDNAFKVALNGQTYDYRHPEILDLTEISKFFKKTYKVTDLKQSGRHVTGVLNDGKAQLFLKLSTTKGISILSQNEFKWNKEFNKSGVDKNFRVPRNMSSGEFNGLFYLITEYLEGQSLSLAPQLKLAKEFENMIPKFIEFSEIIMNKSILDVGKPDVIIGKTPQEWFVNKTKAWFEAIPEEVRNANNIMPLLDIVKSEASSLTTKPRHGDFTPWHLLKTSEGLALLDGEHAMSNGVELYDIAYMIQRVHTISRKEELAIKIFEEACKRGDGEAKLKTVMAARGIGGYLDAYLANKTDFSLEEKFREFVLSI